MQPKVLVPVSDGVEEIEAVTIIDVLRRAGAEVVLAGLKAGSVVGRSRMSLLPDRTLDEALAGNRIWDLVVLPGGLPNAHTLRDDPRVIELLQETASAGRRVAAICAAPVALQRAGLLEGRPVTAYPGSLKGIAPDLLSEAPVVESGNIITSRGPGTAMAFSLALVRVLFGEKTAVKISGDVIAVPGASIGD